MNDDCVIETVALTRRYGRKLALDHLDLRIPRGFLAFRRHRAGGDGGR